MADEFEYISRARLEYRDGYRYAYLGEVREPVVYGIQGALRQYYTTVPRKGRWSPQRSTISWPPSQGECTARCAAPWPGARSRSIVIRSRLPSTVAFRHWQHDPDQVDSRPL